MCGFLATDSTAGRANNDCKKWNNYTHPHKYSHSSPRWTTPLWVSLSLSWCLHVAQCNKQNLTVTSYRHFKRRCFWVYAFFHHFPQNHTPFFQSLSLFSGFSLLSPKDTTVSGVKTWLWFGFSKAMSHAGLFSPQWTSGWSICPHMCSAGPALPTLLIAGDVLDSVQLTSKETRYIIVRRGTSGDQTEADFVRLLNLSQQNALDTSVWAA